MTKKNKYVGKVLYIHTHKNSRPRYRWIVRQRDDGRYIARTPKIHTLIRQLKYKRDKDFGKEHLLPNDFSFWKHNGSRRSTRKRKSI